MLSATRAEAKGIGALRNTPKTLAKRKKSLLLFQIDY